jgi:TolB-like protein/DNA-binding winged helix-turn-helix (wHTH) protein/Tfp pilus assembly protein PilF
MLVGHTLTSAVFMLKGLRADPATGLVVGPGGETRLEPRVMSLLQVLAGRAGEVVTRSELLDALWSGHGVYDEALTQCVYQLRLQLAEAAGDARFRKLVKTIPKRGYLLQGLVTPVESDLSESPEVAPSGFGSQPGDQGSAPAGTRRKPSTAVLGLVLLLVLASAWGGWRLMNRQQPAAAPAAPNTIAVLPFLPVLPEQRDPVLEFGLADTLITRLSNTGQLVVRPISAVRPFGDPGRDSLQAGQLLQVDTVVEGTLHRAGDKLRVTARLLRVADGTALWAGSFDASLADVFTMQDAICEQIAESLLPSLKPRLAKSSAGGTTSTEAWELYLQGRYRMVRLTRADLLASLDLFQQAVVLDPNYAQAWLGLAHVNSRLPLAGEVAPANHYDLARQAALQALRIDDSLAGGYAALGSVSLWSEHDWAASERYFQHAIELNPNDFDTHLGYANLLGNTGRYQQALLEIRRARQINPLHPMAAALEAGFLQHAGHELEALRMLEAAVRQNGQFWLARMVLALYYQREGRIEEAMEQIQEAKNLAPNSTYVMANQVEILVAAGQVDEARGLVAALGRKASQEYVSPYHLALANVNAGNTGQAIAWLRTAVAEGSPMLVLLGVHSSWHNLRDLPEFNEILRQVNLAGIDF